MQNHYSMIKSQFFNALAWNGISYSFYKITYTIFTLTLYRMLSTDFFSAWVLIHGIVFLSLLLLDGGMRKSIPRFIHFFNSTKQAHILFIIAVLAIQALTLLIIGIPLILYSSRYFFSLPLFNDLYFYIISIFLIEGIISLINTLYQAHFLQNVFGLFYIFSLVGETIANAIAVKFFASTPCQNTLLLTLLTNKIISRLLLIVTSISTIPILTKQQLITTTRYAKKSPITPNLSLTHLFIAFGKHSLIMWASTLIKSFSERNFLLLIFTKTLGPTTANLFKISHDSTLLFQRIIIKTIGVSDTTLLAHTQSQEPHHTKAAFLLLYNTIIKIMIPLLCLVVFIFIYKTYYTSTAMIFILVIFTFSYCIEIMFSPYERVLETSNLYSALWKSYFPYLIIFPCATAALIILKINFIIYLLIIQTSRIISSLCMRFYARKLHLIN